MSDTAQEKKKMPKAVKYLLRILLVLFTAVLIVFGGLAGAIYMLNYGPSGSAREMFVLSVRETSALKFLADLVLPPDMVESIVTGNAIEEFGTISNPNLIVIPEKNDENPDVEEKDIEIVPVRGITFSGRMMIVKDPSRVKVGVCKNLGNASKSGEYLDSMLKRYNAVAGVNGGGFDDPGGYGSGSIPEGFVFSGGKMVYGTDETKCVMAGFNNDNVLVVGKMTGAEAKARDIRDAIAFGPILVQDGQPANVTGLTLNLNPRTAIGQRADGAVLILVIDGRQANSLGASYTDLIEVMMQFNAINACNMDGGSSSAMYYEGELISNLATLTGGRTLPDCIYIEKR